MSALNERVLILNKYWTAIRVKNVKHAILLVTRDRANMVDHKDWSVHEWQKWIEMPVRDSDKCIVTTRGKIRVPELIVLTHYSKMPNAIPRLSKRNIFIRDEYKCQYTGEKVTPRNADVDHVIPKSKGGKTTWDNLVVCSKDINREKADRTPEEAGVNLLKEPKRPPYIKLIIDPNMEIKSSWKKFLVEKDE